MSIIVVDLFEFLIFTDQDALFSYLSIHYTGFAKDAQVLVSRVAVGIWLSRGRLLIIIFRLVVAATEVFPTLTAQIAYYFVVHIVPT